MTPLGQALIKGLKEVEMEIKIYVYYSPYTDDVYIWPDKLDRILWNDFAWGTPVQTWAEYIGEL